MEEIGHVLSSWHPWAELAPVRASHQIRLESFRMPGLGTAQVDFRDCTAILGLGWSRDPVGLTKFRSLLTRIYGGDWSGNIQLATWG